jgi:formate/nitrite transporter FocA (FNT family)
VVGDCGRSVDGRLLLAKGIFHVKLEGSRRILLENLGYTFGFIIVIMARQQLFTENTVTAVLPVMHNPTPETSVC